MHPLKKLAIAVIAACLFAHSADATVVYSYIANSSTYSAPVGSTVAVTIDLQESLTAASQSYITAQGGLLGAGAAFNVVSTSGGAAAKVVSGSFTGSSGFPSNQDIFYNQGQTAATQNNLEFSEAVAPNSPPTYVFPTGNLVPLGTVNITVGSGSTTYLLTSLNDDTINNSFSQLGQSDGNTLTSTQQDLDKVGNSAYTGADASPGFTFTVSPTPEPGSLMLAGLALGGLLLRRRNRR